MREQINQSAFYKFQTEVSVFHLNLTIKTFISQSFLLENGEDVIVEEFISSWGLVTPFIQPTRNFAVSHTFVVKVLDSVVQF